MAKRWKGDSIYNPIFVSDPTRIPMHFTIRGSSLTTEPINVAVTWVPDTTEETLAIAPEGNIIYVRKGDIAGDLIQNTLGTNSEGIYRRLFEGVDDETPVEVKIRFVALGMSENQLNAPSNVQLERVNGDRYYGYRRTYYMVVYQNSNVRIVESPESGPIIYSVRDEEDAPEITLVGRNIRIANLVKFEYPNGEIKYADIPQGNGHDYYGLYGEEAENKIKEEQNEFSQQQGEKKTLWKSLETDAAKEGLESFDLYNLGTDRVDYETAKLAILVNFGKNIDDILDPGLILNGTFVLRYSHPLEDGEFEKRAIYFDSYKLLNENIPIADALYYSVEWADLY